MRCPGYRWRDSSLGSDMELENLSGGDKGKGTSGSPARPKVPIRQVGADRSAVVTKRGNARGAKGTGHSSHGQFGQLATGGTVRRGGGRQLSMNGTSRVTGDSQARFCERLGVKLPGPTRRRSAMTAPTATPLMSPTHGKVPRPPLFFCPGSIPARFDFQQISARHRRVPCS